MYLVFILFAFIYAPTNSLDSLLFSTKSMKRATSLLMPENKILKESLQTDTGFINKYQPLYYSVMTINDSVDYIINTLDSFQTVLLEPNKKGEGEFPINFRSASMAGRVFVYNNAAEELRLSILRIKNSLDSVGLKEIKLGLDSLLPSTEIILNSKGLERDWTSFFFAKTPKAVLLLTTEKIKTDLLNLSRDLLKHLIAIRQSTSPAAPIASPDNSMFVVRLLNGSEVPIKLDWSSVANDSIKQQLFTEVAKNKLIGSLQRNGETVSQAVFNQKPMLPQPPPAPLKQDQMYAFVGSGGYHEMYLGVDNPVEIAFSAPSAYRQDITVSDGELVTKNGKYFLRFKKEGFTRVGVSAVKGVDRKLLQEREFKVILIPNPDVYLSGYKGGIISKDIVRVSKGIELKNEASNLTDDVYTCESFDVTLVPFDNPIGEIKVRGNIGASFSAESTELLKNVKRGDVIVLDNFKIRTAEGIVRRIPTVIYRVI